MYGQWVRSFAFLAVVFFVTVSAAPPASQPNPPCNTGATLDIDCAAFPNTGALVQPDWDYFAWNTFIAANWPAIDPAKNNEQRGIPDLTKRFTEAASDSLLTWETYKEKREVFYPVGNASSPGKWNKAPQYGPLMHAASIPMCGSERSGQPRRFFAQGGKVPFNSLDETVEVPSEALESRAQLCQGVDNPSCGPDNLGADCCRARHLPVSPRVWKGRPSDGQPVVYEVKVNYDFFKYVVDHGYYQDQKASDAAAAGEIRLPYRTSAKVGPSAHNKSAVLGYDAMDAMSSYKNVTPTSNITPALSGAIHLKAAWILLKDEDRSRYHTTEAAYFKTESGRTCMAYGTFGLVGLHIIQRVHRSHKDRSFAEGGDFVFATWEHVDNDTAGFTYSNYYGGQNPNGSPASGFYPALSETLPVRRQFPILPSTQNVNKTVHEKIKSLNPKSVWRYYHLIGTQFQPANVLQPSDIPSANDPTGTGQPLFLANSVIETNVGLQNFQGLPPGEVPIEKFAAHGIDPNPFKTAFNRTSKNVSFAGTGYNMGGCMGCHGVAQLRGYSFSFVLLLGQRGAGVDTEKNFPPVAMPPAPQPTQPKK